MFGDIEKSGPPPPPKTSGDKEKTLGRQNRGGHERAEKKKRGGGRGGASVCGRWIAPGLSLRCWEVFGVECGGAGIIACGSCL